MAGRWYGDRALRKLLREADRITQNGAEYLLDESNKKVPYEEGILEGSGVVKKVGDDGDGIITYKVSYDTPYAIRLHEHPEYNFNGGREGKWLENTLKDEERAVLDYLVQEIRRSLR